MQVELIFVGTCWLRGHWGHAMPKPLCAQPPQPIAPTPGSAAAGSTAATPQRLPLAATATGSNIATLQVQYPNHLLFDSRLRLLVVCAAGAEQAEMWPSRATRKPAAVDDLI